MNVHAAGMAVAATMLMAGSAAAEADSTPAVPRMIVRTYLQQGVSDDDLRTARAYAESVFHPTGVTLVWIDCVSDMQASVDATAQCSGPVAANEIILRLAAAHDTGAAAVAALGTSLVNMHVGGTPPLFSTVFCDRVGRAARTAGVDRRRVLGYAIAHELGHLLLDTPQHPDSGLMRALWSGGELRRNKRADWEFHASEAAAIRSAVEMRESAPMSASD